MVAKHLNCEEESWIVGSVKVSALDIDGSILALDFIDEMGQSFLLADNRQGEMLIKYIGRRISIQGKLITEPEQKIIEVSQFVLL